MSIHDKFDRMALEITRFSGSIYAASMAISTVGFWIIGGCLFWGFGLLSQSVINSVATLITFLIVFFIQYSQNRSDRVLNIKLDEVIRAIKAADNQMICLDDLTPEQLEEIHKKYVALSQKG